MNRAAGAAVPQAKCCWSMQQSEMAVSDAETDPHRGEGSVTQYFKGKTERPHEMFPAEVRKSTDKLSLSSQVQQSSPARLRVSGWWTRKTQQVESYVTRKALDGLT